MIGTCSENVSTEVLGLINPSILPRFAYWEGVLRREGQSQNDREFLNEFVSDYYAYLDSSGVPSPRSLTLSPSPIPSFSPLLCPPPPFSPPVPTLPPLSPLLSPPPPPPDSPPPLSSPPPPPPSLPPLSPLYSPPSLPPLSRFPSPILFTAFSPSLPDVQTNDQTNGLPSPPHAPQTNYQTNDQTHGQRNAFPINNSYESTDVIDHYHRIDHNHHHHHFHNHFHYHYSFDPPRCPPADPQPSCPPGVSPSRLNPLVGPPPSYNPPPFDFNRFSK
jgi:hypothetical protein